MTRDVLSFVLACGMLARPTLATAQPARGTMFVSGIAIAAIESNPIYGSRDLFGVAGNENTSTVAGGTLSLGVHLTPRISARAEWTLTDTVRRDLDNAQLLAVVAFGTLGSTPAELTLPPFAQTTTSAMRKREASALVAYHLGSGRASLELVAGLGLINRRGDTVDEIRYTAPLFGVTLPPSRTESHFSSVDATAVVGLDLAFTLTDHASLVPQVRVYSQSGGVSLRPGLGFRWTF